MDSPARKNGKLRNIMAMGDKKLFDLACQMTAYPNDVDAIQKIRDRARDLGMALTVDAVLSTACPTPPPPATATPAPPVAEWNDTFYQAAKAGNLAQLAEASKRELKSYKVGEWVMEPKLDGWRILAHIDEYGKVTLFSRSGKTYQDQVPKICQALSDRFPPNTVLDGEMVSLHVDEKGAVVDEWGVVQSVMTQNGPLDKQDKVTYMVFDLIRLDGHNARPLPYDDRRSLLERLFEAVGGEPPVVLIPSYDPSEDQHEKFLEAGFEGSVLKRRNAVYSSGARGAGWDKMKPTETLDGVVMGFREGKSSFTGLIGSIVFGQHKDGKLVEVGACSGMDYKTRQEISANQDAWIGTVIEVEHQAAIGEAPRFPRFKRVRDDKDPDKV